MTRRAFDVVIIGAGIQGLFCAYSLLELGIKSIGILDCVGYAGGRSTKRSAAMLTRLTGHPSTTALAERSIQMYRVLGPILTEQSGIDVRFSWCGFAILGYGDEARKAVNAEYLEHRRLDLVETDLCTGSELREWTSGLIRYPDDAIVCYSPTDGFVNIDSLTNALVEAVKRGGATLDVNAEATGIRRSGNEVAAVELAHGETVETRVVVNAAGVMAGRVAAWVDRDVGIVASKKNLITVGNNGRQYEGPIVECQDDGWYFRPDGAGLLVGVGRGREDPPDVAERGDPDIDPDAVEECKAYLGQWTSIPRNAIDAITIGSGTAGYRPIHEHDSPSEDRAPAHLPLFGAPIDGPPGYFESCGWGEFGVTLGPVGGAEVAQQVAASKRV